MIQQGAFRDRENNLMKMKKQKNQSKTAGRMFGIDASSHRGSKISHERLGDPVETDRIVVTKSILKNTDRRSQKHAAHGIAPADSEINGHQQRQIDKLGPVAELVKETLQDQGQKNREDHGAAIILVTSMSIAPASRNLACIPYQLCAADCGCAEGFSPLGATRCAGFEAAGFVRLARSRRRATGWTTPCEFDEFASELPDSAVFFGTSSSCESRISTSSRRSSRAAAGRESLEMDFRARVTHHSDQQSLGENAIFAGSENHLAAMHFFVVHHVIEARIGITAAFTTP